MAFNRPIFADLLDRIKQDFQTRLDLTGAPLRRSVVAIFARVVAGAAHLLHGHLDWISRQVFPDTSEAEFLDRQASLYSITRTAATFATGNVTFTGTNGTEIPEGTVVQTADGVQYATDALGTISGGTATVAVTAVVAGADGEADVGVTVSLTSPIAGITTAATVAAGGLTGGADEEDDDALRARLLARMREPPAGGAEHDYIAWALEVAGVTRAWVYPAELGAGTVVVRFMRDDDVDPIPSAGEVTTVQDYIDERRPVTAAVTVAAPTALALDLEIEITPDTAAIREAVEAELEDLLNREAEPGGTIYLSQINEAISIAAGETDHILTDPVANVTHTTGQIAVLGTITWV